MSKIKLTKGELKRQRDALAQFQRYLPTLQLKKQQLQMKVLEARARLADLQKKLTDQEHGILQWVGLLADPQIKAADEQGNLLCDIKRYVIPSDIQTGTDNVAGAYVPVLKGVTFAQQDYDLYTTPFWLDRAVEVLQALMRVAVEIHITEQRISRLNRELRVTTQRVNLFEKVKIPESLENIRRINIYLGDQQANTVGISKVAKKKITLAAVAG